MSGRKKYLRCACCGSDAGKWHQWPNQDTGYGICRRCVDWVTDRGMSAEDLRRTYGEENKNYSPKTEGDGT